MKNNYIVMGVIVVIVAAGAFFGGMQYQKSKTPTLGNGQFGRFTGNGQRGQNSPGQVGTRASSMRPVSGEVLSVDDTSITVKMMDGSSKIVILSGNTTINKSSEGSKNDLKPGEQVTAFGTANSDGSVTAQTISLGTTFRTFQQNGSPSPTPSK